MKYFLVKFSIDGYSTLLADSYISAKNELIDSRLNQLVLNTSEKTIRTSVKYIAEMYKRCPRCNSKLLTFDAQRQKAYYLLFDNTIDSDNPIERDIYEEQHNSIKCSNLKCGYSPS
jgi:hypothetical protein